LQIIPVFISSNTIENRPPPPDASGGGTASGGILTALRRFIWREFGRIEQKEKERARIMKGTATF
jgi:hypothetical protein